MIAPAIDPIAQATERLSWSRIKCYQDCPRKFFFRYVQHASEERTSAALPFGSSLHRAAELVAEARLIGCGMPSVDQMMEAYDRTWKESACPDKPLCYAKDESPATLRELGEKMLVAYREFAASEQSTVIGIEHEAPVRVAGIPLVARLDLVEMEGEDLIVSDLKTSRSKWSDAKVQESLSQLIVYAHAARPMLDALGAKRIRPRFVVLTKAKSPSVQVIEPKAESGHVSRLKELVLETRAAIESRAFPRREGWQCAQCPFRTACLGK